MRHGLGRGLSLGALCIGLAGGLAPVGLAAQEAPAEAQADRGGIEDVVVTARRRAEAEQDVPISITAFNADTLTDRSIKQVSDLADITPNLARTSGPTGGNDAFFFIRGIGQVDSNPAADPGVGVYIDGVYLARIQGASVDAYDLQRVEVLRGPQGTLFGRNTIGGAVSLTTADPGDTLSFRARETLGSRHRVDFFGTLDLPVSPTLGIRVSGGYREQRGWGKNVYTGERLGSIENLTGRLKAVWKPTDALRFTLSADALRARGTSAQTILVGFNPGGGQPIPGATPLGVPFPADLAADTSTDPFKSFVSIDPRNDVDNRGVSLTSEWTLADGLSVKLIDAYRKVDQFATNDFDGTGYRFYDNFFDTGSSQWSHELQLLGDAFDKRLDYVLGAYLFKESINNNNAICLGTNLGFPGSARRNAGGCIRNNQQFDLGIRSVAAFGQASFKITPALSLTLGGRYTRERKRQAFDFFIDNSAGVFSFFGLPPIAVIPTLSPRNPRVGVPTTYRDTWEQFTPKAGLDYKVNPDLLLYASYSKGFKSGGFNGRPSPNAQGGFNPILPYDPERLDAYEAGIKSDWLDRRLRINLAGFHSSYKGIQLLVLDPGSGFFNTANAGRSSIWGFEAETTLRPVPAATVYANVGYTHDKYKALDQRAVISGIGPDDRLPVTPRWTVGVGGSYRADLGDTVGALEARADYSYRSSVFYGATNEPLEYQRGFGLLNLRATYTDPVRTLLAVGLRAQRHRQTLHLERSGRAWAAGRRVRPDRRAARVRGGAGRQVLIGGAGSPASSHKAWWSTTGVTRKPSATQKTILNAITAP